MLFRRERSFGTPQGLGTPHAGKRPARRLCRRRLVPAARSPGPSLALDAPPRDDATRVGLVTVLKGEAPSEGLGFLPRILSSKLFIVKNAASRLLPEPQPTSSERVCHAPDVVFWRNRDNRVRVGLRFYVFVAEGLSRVSLLCRSDYVSTFRGDRVPERDTEPAKQRHDKPPRRETQRGRSSRRDRLDDHGARHGSHPHLIPEDEAAAVHEFASGLALSSRRSPLFRTWLGLPAPDLVLRWRRRSDAAARDRPAPPLRLSELR